MREFWRKTMFWSAIGFVLGMLVGLAFLALGGSLFSVRNGPGRLAVQLIVSGLIGAINMGSMMIYSLERWGILRCTLTHFCIVMATLCAVGFPMGWFSLGDLFTLCILIGCVIVYFIIWLINYLLYRRQVHQINAALARWKTEQDDE